MDAQILQRLEPDMRAFMARHNSLEPSPGPRPNAIEERAAYARYAASVQAPRPEGIDIDDVHIGGPRGDIALRRYRPRGVSYRATVLYFHGGGWVVGDLDTHNDICWDLALALDCEVVAVDYRLAPEHPYPAAFEDCLGALMWARRQSDARPILLAGDSAGGNLAAAVSLVASERGLTLAGQALIYPALSAHPLPSHQSLAQAPSLTLDDMHYYWRCYLGTDGERAEATAAPLHAREFGHLPPTYVSAAELDPLCDDGLVFVERLQQAGVPARARLEKGLPHSFLRARRDSAAAAEAWQQLLMALSQMLDGSFATRTSHAELDTSRIFPSAPTRYW